MNENEVLTANDEALQEARVAVGRKIEALPARFPISGFEVSWEERAEYDFVKGEDGHSQMVNYPTLYIKPTTRDYHHDLSIEIKTDGTVKYYSFYSSSGNNNEDAAETVKYYQACITLLSKDFQDAVIQDYQNKLESLEALKAEFKAIDSEQDRRKNEIKNEQKAKEKQEAAERHVKLETIGQIWFDFGYYSSARYVVKSVTEKTVTFDIYDYNEKEGSWNQIGNTKRVSKHLLGVKPRRRERGIVTICPVGTDDLASQKPGQPDTVAY